MAQAKDKISKVEQDRIAGEKVQAKALSLAKSHTDETMVDAFAKAIVAEETNKAAMFNLLDARFGNPETGFPQWYKLRADHVKPEGACHNLKWLWDDLRKVYDDLMEAVKAKGHRENTARQAWSRVLKYGVQVKEGGVTREPTPSRQVIREGASKIYRKIMRDEFATDEMTDDAAVMFAIAVRYGADAARLADIT